MEVSVSGPQYRRAKGDQEARGQVTIVPAVVFGIPLASLWREHVAELFRSGLTEDDRAFRDCGPKARGRAWASDGEALSALVKRLVKAVKDAPGTGLLAEGNYSAHSLRRGGAQYLRDQGIPKELVKLQGRWRSNAIDAYYKTAAKKVMVEVAAAFG